MMMIAKPDFVMANFITGTGHPYAATSIRSGSRFKRRLSSVGPGLFAIGAGTRKLLRTPICVTVRWHAQMCTLRSCQAVSDRLIWPHQPIVNNTGGRIEIPLAGSASVNPAFTLKDARSVERCPAGGRRDTI